MNFGTVLQGLKKGNRYARKGWNGKGQYIAYVCESVADKEIKRICPGSKRMLPWIGINTVDNSFVPWLASQTDMLADDWVKVK